MYHVSSNSTSFVRLVFSMGVLLAKAVTMNVVRFGMVLRAIRLSSSIARKTSKTGVSPALLKVTFVFLQEVHTVQMRRNFLVPEDLWTLV